LDNSGEATGKVVFVTGASRGFGALIVEMALARGHRVVATARNPRLLIDRFGDHPGILAISLDVTDEAQAHAAAMAAIERFGHIDVLVNSSVAALFGAVEEASAREVEVLYRTNVFGLLAATRAVLPYMRRRRSGRIINFSRVGGRAAHAGWGVYCSTRLAVEGLSEALDAELRPLGIRVTVMECGCLPAASTGKGSVMTSTRTIADYRDASGAFRAGGDGVSGARLSDPATLAHAVLQVIDEPQGLPRP
jgi:NAD(P)-dependent dehydrogenase (short-subunit alcohol dehydrogenase family)